jgi:hypothetical protein
VAIHKGFNFFAEMQIVVKKRKRRCLLTVGSWAGLRTEQRSTASDQHTNSLLIDIGQTNSSTANVLLNSPKFTFCYTGV